MVPATHYPLYDFRKPICAPQSIDQLLPMLIVRTLSRERMMLILEVRLELFAVADAQSLQRI